MGDDVAGEGVVVRPLAEGDPGGDGALEIFVGDLGEAVLAMLLQGFAGFDLMPGDPDFHHILQLLYATVAAA
jgi:hypothetical protein